MRSWFLTAFVAAATIVLGGCDSMNTANRRPARPLAKPAAQPASATTLPTSQPTTSSTAGNAQPASSGGEVMAYVNGHAVLMAPLHEMLVRAGGMEAAQQLIANELVNQAATREGITATADEVQAEHERTLADMFPDVKEPDQRQRLLDQLLLQKGVTREQWDMTMQRNLLLGKLSSPRVVILESDIEAEFAEQYGRRVVIRHIQSATLGESQEVLERLKAGEGFAALASKVSKNASAADGGLLAPIGAKAEGLPPAMRDAALAMKTIGDVAGPIQVGTTYHLLCLEQIIDPKDVKIDDVRDELTERLRSRMSRALKQQMLVELIRSAKIEYVNPVLSQQAQEAQKENKP